jgi:predicted RND superfamily exporter protein
MTRILAGFTVGLAVIIGVVFAVFSGNGLLMALNLICLLPIALIMLGAVLGRLSLEYGVSVSKQDPRTYRKRARPDPRRKEARPLG